MYSSFRFSAAILGLFTLGHPDPICAEVARARFPITTLYETNPPIVGGFMMGAETLGPPASWSTRSTSDWLVNCQRRSEPGSLWPSSCDPAGMASATAELARQLWVVSVPGIAEPNKAFNYIFAAVRATQSAAVLPLWGRVDRWIAAYEIDADAAGSNYIINRLDGVISFPTTMILGGRLIGPSVLRFAAMSFVGQYVQILDPAAGARYFNRFIVSWDPPPGYTPTPFAGSLTWAKPAGVVKAGETMSGELASERVFEALHRAGFDRSEDVRKLLAQGVPSQALRVEGTKATGGIWPYYLVPIRDQEDRLLAMAQLSAEDGSVETLLSLPNAVPYQPLSLGQVVTIAREQLKSGESLGAPTLGWDARAIQNVGTPHFPYYRVPVKDAKGRDKGAVLVMAHSGQMLGRTE